LKFQDKAEDILFAYFTKYRHSGGKQSVSHF